MPLNFYKIDNQGEFAPQKLLILQNLECISTFSALILHASKSLWNWQSWKISPCNSYLFYSNWNVSVLSVLWFLQAKLSTELCYGTFGCTVTANIPVLSKTVVRVSKCTKVTQTPTPTSNCFSRNGSSSGGKSNTTIDGGGIKWSDLFTTTKMPPHSTVKSRKYCCIMGNQGNQWFQ